MRIFFRLATPAALLFATSPALAQALPGASPPGSLIARQSALSEDVLLLGQEIRRAELLERLIGMLGPEAFARLYPDLAALVAGSPMEAKALAAREAALPKEAKPPVAGAGFADGSELVRVERKPDTPPTQSTPREGPRVQAAAPAQPAPQRLKASLREISGTDVLSAVLEIEGKRLRLVKGDEIDGGWRVEAITAGSLTLVGSAGPVVLTLAAHE
jgi:type IV pilus biogenesis protein PilP